MVYSKNFRNGTSVLRDELAWICAIMPEEINNQITGMCKELNREIGLPETVFKFPLHISLKKSFRTHDFDGMRDDAHDLLNRHMPMSCRINGVTLHRNMIWLNIKPNESLLAFHKELDNLLLNNYDIIVDKYDRIFQPHISLFTSGERDKIIEMYELLKTRDLNFPNVEFHKFVIGSSLHKDTFYNL